MASDRPTRPLGVLERFRALTAEDRRHVESRPEWRMRTAVLLDFRAAAPWPR